jgi:hypothetical protein
VERRCVWSSNLVREEAKAQQRAVKYTPTMGCVGPGGGGESKQIGLVYVSVISEAMQWDCTRNTLFLQAVNEYDVTMYVLRNYKLAVWMSENNNGSWPAHLLLLTVCSASYIHGIYKGFNGNEQGTKYLQVKTHNCTLQSTEQ